LRAKVDLLDMGKNYTLHSYTGFARPFIPKFEKLRVFKYSIYKKQINSNLLILKGS